MATRRPSSPGAAIATISASKPGARAALAPKSHPRLFHTVLLYPDRASLGAAVTRVQGRAQTGADHAVSEVVHFDDPDGNGLELYRDGAPQDWPCDAQGRLATVNDPLDVAALVACAP